CRMCIVYNESTKRLITSCNTYPEEGMRISLQNELVRSNQKYLLEAFMTRHPLDCPICDKAGECDLQNYGAIFGPQRQIVPISALEKERHEHDWQSDFLEYYSNRCVVCYRCTRACDEVVGARALFVDDRGFHANIVPAIRPMDTSSCEMCGICVHVCPVGAIISKPFKYWTRSWLLKRESTACFICSGGCEISLEYGVGDWRSKAQIYRTKPSDKLDICARAFFGYDALEIRRLSAPVVHSRQETMANAGLFVAGRLKSSKDKAAIFLSPFMSNEDIELSIKIARAVGAVLTSTLSIDVFEFLKEYGEYSPPSREEIEACRRWVLIGRDVSASVPVLSYYIKGEVFALSERFEDEKLSPKLITLEDLKALEPAMVVLNVFGMPKEQLRDYANLIKNLSHHRLLLLHPDGNYLGMVEALKAEQITPLELALEAIKEGFIKTAIVFGEDLTQVISVNDLTKIFSNLEHLCVISPYLDGLAQLANVKVPMGLLGEIDGTMTSIFGKVRLKSFLPWAKDHGEFLKAIVEQLPDNDVGIKTLQGNSSIELKSREISLFMSSWVTSQSQHLRKLYEKRQALKELST
ncbi:MAG: 4Fe-4S binding protein, partial [Aquificaceae bacterium]|nr:4Fe-4S binding protein [Aquificaceae bacterium]MDW8237622.1 4Fe-4S binding protein [Aquificaceae bacterium]